MTAPFWSEASDPLQSSDAIIANDFHIFRWKLRCSATGEATPDPDATMANKARVPMITCAAALACRSIDATVAVGQSLGFMRF